MRTRLRRIHSTSIPAHSLRLEQTIQAPDRNGTTEPAPCTARRCHRRRMSRPPRTAGSRGRTIHRRHPRSLHSKRRRLGRSRRLHSPPPPGRRQTPGRRRTPQRTARLEGDAQTARHGVYALPCQRHPPADSDPATTLRSHGRRRSVRPSAVCPRLRAPSLSAARVPPSPTCSIVRPCARPSLSPCSQAWPPARTLKGAPRPLRQTRACLETRVRAATPTPMPTRTPASKTQVPACRAVNH